jgi:hypothetical protein
VRGKTRNQGDRSIAPSSKCIGREYNSQMALFARGVVGWWLERLRAQPACHAVSSQLPPASTMDANSQRPKGRDGTLSSLNMAIDALNLAKDVVGIAPAKAAFGSVSALLTMIRVRFCLFCDDGLRAHVCPGFDGERTGIRRARVELRRHLQSP